MALFLSACQTTPAPLYKGLTQEQIEVVKSYGFEEVDDGWKYDLSGKVLFNTDSSELNSETTEKLKQLAQVLRDIGIHRIVVEGHTDNVGSSQYNEALSKKRAQVVANELVKSGFTQDAIQVRAMGFTKPVAANNTEQGRRENRRVSLIIGSSF